MKRLCARGFLSYTCPPSQPVWLNRKALAGIFAALLLCTGLEVFRPAPDAESVLKLSWAILGSADSTPEELARAAVEYRSALRTLLPNVEKHSRDLPLGSALEKLSGYYRGDFFSDITPIWQSPETTPGLHRPGLGLPAIGIIVPGGDNSPLAGYRVPLTLLALPMGSPPTSFEVRLADPSRIETMRVGDRTFPVAMDLEAPLDATHATGPRFLDGLRHLLRSDRKKSRLTFLQPYDPEKIPIVLIHGLISTPRMWAPVVKGLLAVPEIRKRYQFWFFYFPTGQPIPLSALQLREALDEALLAHRVNRPLILIGHSMGGILARAQASRITPEAADEILPKVSSLAVDRTVRRSLIFEPRTDVQRLVFICTPHRGSQFATSGIAGLGIRLIQLPSWIAEELVEFAEGLFSGHGGQLPTSIHGLSPYSRFLEALNQAPPASPSHSIIGEADGVAPLSTAHLDSAISEVLVPAGHGGFVHPAAIEEMKRILMPAAADRRPFDTTDSEDQARLKEGFQRKDQF